ncbi:hypothetical protein BCR34DRAFT_79550 [Clohesyomyces aquaticus]|uniref:Zn(2)-C6 fungal-type domain-containing protein n=1 Tax=Clohesyomyces aquaticus TaxID=1231657 RepID=A0A1Y1YXP6_9PLEO|nr:hypothetical protein BCR34DRAFT_79550 [Clohesyomyces aquaticus]
MCSLVCRARRVKCMENVFHDVHNLLNGFVGDEVKPVCGPCRKKRRPCGWQPCGITMREYRPNAVSNATEVEGADCEDVGGDGISRPDVSSPYHLQPPNFHHASPLITSPDALSDTLSATYPTVRTPLQQQLSYPEAALVHHYAQHLGRWLDCTDALRQFTLRIPVLVKQSPLLLHAVLSFGARHCGDAETADQAYHCCLSLLIERLGLSSATHDDALLCAIVILRVFEQLNVPVATGSDHEQHLAGCSAILRASQGQTIDPSAPTLREAAFWVYVRQCLYNASINQQPPNLDVNIRLHPAASTFQFADPLATLKGETAWANNMTWLCASVVQFCFGGGADAHLELSGRLHRWRELWNDVQQWSNDRPTTFDPIWAGPAGNDHIFPRALFAADWHVMAFGFFNFACLLLLTYKPAPRFAVRNLGGNLRETDHRILDHARAICGSCEGSPATVPALITLCHSVFIWGPLMTDAVERQGVLRLLTNFEDAHVWPTTWIANALREEWGMQAQIVHNS